MHSRDYKDLIVWQKSVELVVLIYQLTEHFPKSELFGLTDQMRRCGVSIPSNIAEGSKRGTQKDFLHFLRIAYGSASELETQIEIARRLQRADNAQFSKPSDLLYEIVRMLHSLIAKLAENCKLKTHVRPS